MNPNHMKYTSAAWDSQLRWVRDIWLHLLKVIIPEIIYGRAEKVTVA